MHTTWANDPVNSPNHYTRSHPGMECIELTADTSFCLGNAIKYLWRYHSKGRPVEDLEKARWYLCHVIDHDEKIAWTRQQHAILDTLANDPAIPDAGLGNDSPAEAYVIGYTQGHDDALALAIQLERSINRRPFMPDEAERLAMRLHEQVGDCPIAHESGNAMDDSEREWWVNLAASAWTLIDGTEETE